MLFGRRKPGYTTTVDGAADPEQVVLDLQKAEMAAKKKPKAEVFSIDAASETARRLKETGSTFDGSAAKAGEDVMAVVERETSELAAKQQAAKAAPEAAEAPAVPEGTDAADAKPELLDFLAAHRLSRSDLIVALGGGVTGDLAGFAAATYQRGIPFVQVPTTLLAAVDSSVGGKTAVNLASGKNQVGCFYQPSLVLCDPDTLRTLPPEEYRNGCAEVIKYAVLRSEPFFDALRAEPVSAQVEHVIATCVSMKRDLVAADEFDRGSRQLLNLGHSFGHAVEKCSDYAVPHGCGVAIGMAIIARAAAKRGICTDDTCAQILALLRKYGLPTETAFTRDALTDAARSDKKIADGKLHLIVPERIGRCRIETIPAVDIPAWLADGGIA